MSVSVLTVVNKVLKKLRESAITTITADDYAELITEFLEETNTEVEQAWKWEHLVSTFSLASVASQSEYSITGSPDGSDIITVFDQTNTNYLLFSPEKVDEGLRVASPTEGTPFYWKYSGEDSNGDIQIEVYPVPNSVLALKVKGHYLKGELVYTNPSTNMLTCATQPLVLGTYARAIDERGDDDGEAFNKADAKYRLALGDAISIENGRQGSRNAEWYSE